MKDLNGKLVLVTGAASGIGRATARAFASAGARVVTCDIDGDGLAAVAAELGERNALSRRVDVADRAAMADLAKEVHRLAPAVDVLVNNAGVGIAGGLLDTSLDDWDWLLRINLGGVIHGCHFFVPAMVQRGAGGHVVNVSSVLGYYPAAGMIAYVTSKFAVLGLSLSLRTELEPKGIGVTAICPGLTDTAIIAHSRFVGRTEGARDRVQQTFQRFAYSPERVADAIVAAVRRDRAVAPVSPAAWALWALSRVAPTFGGRIGRRITERTMALE